MYIDEWLYDNITNHEITKSDFEANCAGHAIIEENSPVVTRPNGLPDYQLLYIENGCGYFKFNDEYEKIGGKTAILFKPNEQQIYKYHQKDLTQTYWIHFAGTGVEHFLQELKLADKKTININNDIVLKGYFEKILYELQNKQNSYMRAANSYAQLALIELSRESKNLGKKPSDLTIENLCKKINMYYYENISNSDCAKECAMSVSHFLAKFKNTTGMSPQNYILNLRIRNAQNLLVKTNYKISEIARSVGFSDSMYFCKRFKKLTGISPTEYREEFHY